MDLSNIGRRIAFSLIPVTVILGSAECGLRMAGWPSVEAAFEHNTIYWLTDANQVETQTPHDELSTTFPVTTDSYGLRAPIHGTEKPAGTFRILTMGCSTTFGWGVADGESYPAVLESLVHEAGYDHVEVINGGQPGYTSFQGMWLWEEVLKYYEPDLVLVGYVVQDARDAAYTDQSQAILEGDVLAVGTFITFSQSKIDDVDLIFGCFSTACHEVIRLNISMNNSLFMHNLYSLNHLNGYMENTFQVHLPSAFLE